MQGSFQYKAERNARLAALIELERIEAKIGPEQQRDEYEAAIEECLDKIGIPDGDSPELVVDVWGILWRAIHPEPVPPGSA